jgi:hypothetical protein
MCNVYYLGSDSDLPIFGSANSKGFHVKLVFYSKIAPWLENLQQ